MGSTEVIVVNKVSLLPAFTRLPRVTWARMVLAGVGGPPLAETGVEWALPQGGNRFLAVGGGARLLGNPDVQLLPAGGSCSGQGQNSGKFLLGQFQARLGRGLLGLGAV